MTIRLFAGALLFVVACEPTAPVTNQDPMPPYLLQKAAFADGQEWWLQRTVTSTPMVAGFTFVGDGDYPDRVKFNIEEDFLIAYRSTPKVVGNDPDVSGLNDYEAPVAIWPIKRHFDVINGQIVDAPKRAWYDKQWFEVDWAHDESGTHRFSLGPVEEIPREVPAYYEMKPDDPDPPQFGNDYIDFTTHLTLKATLAQDPEAINAHVCEHAADKSSAVDVIDCSPLDVAYRTSIARIPPDHDYEPLKRDPTSLEDQRWFFRFFRMGTLVVDDQYGLTNAGVDLSLSRFNTWVRSTDDTGARLPLPERTVKPIPFYVDPKFPADMIPEIQEAFKQWDVELRDTLVQSSAWECVDAGGAQAKCTSDAQAKIAPNVIVLCTHNPVVKGDPAECGDEKTAANFGDIRKNVILWETAPQLNHLLGIGWWSPDPSTGEIISSHMTVWGGDIDRASAVARDAVLMAQGRLAPNDVISGAYLGDYLGDLTAYSLNPFASIRSDSAAHPPSDIHAPDPAPPSGVDGPDVALEPTGLPAMRSDALSPAIGTPYETMSLDPEDLRLYGIDPESLDGSDGLDAATVAEVSPLRTPYHESQALTQEISDRLAAVGGDLDIPADLDVAYMASTFADADPEDIYQSIRHRYARWVFTHEMGHILGLRHNFGGSYDAMNYAPDYWALRDDGNLGPRYSDPLTQAELDGGIDQYAYASVMDYYSTAVGAPTTLGYYDKAAVHYAYGSLVEVFNNPTPEGLDYLKYYELGSTLNTNMPVEVPTSDPNIPQGYIHTGVHYSKYQTLIGDLSDRSFVPLSHISDTNHWGDKLADEAGHPVVPYLSCLDGGVNFIAWCLRYDKGADPYEILTNTINWYKTYYVFNSFARGRADFNSAEYTSKVWDRVYNPIRNMFAFSMHFRWAYEAGAFDDPDFLQPLSFGLDESFTFLTRMLATPQPGDYYDVHRPDGINWLEPTNAFTDDLSPFGNQTIFDPVTTPPPDAPIVLNVPVGEGRFYRSFDIDNQRESLVLRDVGSAVDKEMALEALMDPRWWTFHGKGSWADSRIWMVNFSRQYPDQLLDVLGSIVAGDVNRMAPVYDGNKVTYRDFLDINSTQPAGEPLDPAIGFNLRIRTLIYGLGLHLASDSDRTMLDAARIVMVGSGEELASTEPSVDFTDDIFTGKTYRAYLKPVNGVELSVGARLINQAKVLHDAALGLGGESAVDQYNASYMLRDQLDLLDISHALTQKFQSSPFDGNAISDPP